MTRAITRNGALRRRAQRALFHFNKRGTFQVRLAKWWGRRETRSWIPRVLLLDRTPRSLLRQKYAHLNSRMEKLPRLTGATQLISTWHNSAWTLEDARGNIQREKVGDKKEKSAMREIAGPGRRMRRWWKSGRGRREKDAIKALSLAC